MGNDAASGLWGTWHRVDPSVLVPTVVASSRTPSAPAFSSETPAFESIGQAMAYFAGSGRVSRREAIATPAVKRCRDLICALAQSPLTMRNEHGVDVTRDARAPWTLLSQPEAKRAGTVTWAWVVEDLIFERVARLRVTEVGWHGRPVRVERMEPGTYSRDDKAKGYWLNRPGARAEWIPDAQVIEIESPNDALLVAGAGAIRALSLINAAGLNAVSGIPPQDYFESADPNVDPFESNAEAQEFLDSWAAARAKRSTAFIPSGVKYQTNGFDPKQLQLVELRTEAIAEIGRLTGVDAEDLGVPTTTRTYFNAQDRRRALLDFVIGPYRRAIEERLSMEDIAPPGYTARFDTTEFGRADDLTTAQTDEILARAGIASIDELRALRKLPPLAAGVPAEVSAALDLAKAAPSLAASPGLPALAAGIKALMDGNLPTSETEPTA